VEPTFQLDRETSIWSFDENNEPAIRVDPGAIIEIETWDCFTGQVTSEADTLDKLDLNRINSATGPIGVNGAEPGDMLSVRLLDIRPNAQGASMTIPGWGQLHEKVKSPVTRIYQVHDGVISMNERVKFPVRPMFGVIGVSPASGNISTFESGRHGGNLDDHMNGIGAVVHLPVFQSGGQLAIGDMHASMGDGEICGTGVEIGGTGLISIDLIKGRQSQWPITETSDSIYTHGTSPDNIDEALDAACDEAMRLLVDQWEFSSEDAFMFLSVACDLGIAAYYHPSPGCATARMRIPKISAVPSAFKS
jgi:amidase